jgi:CheW-like domain
VADDLKNVIVFTLTGARHATELRWVKEVVSLGFVTAVPTAPSGITGAFNLRGNLVPVLDVGALANGSASAVARQGDSALLVEIDGVTAALRVDKVEEVATLVAGPAGTVVDARGRSFSLIDPAALVRTALASANAARLGDDEVRPRDSTTGAATHHHGHDGDVTLA